ncbi:hypothetical protein [Rhodococcoides corynebacterioides]|uniref:hypothetical protein n=1 Tax=Rhodococcoides corynebacterioides TaxID=53972 RepID=UPI001C9B2DA6|nr:hypothetical protein [Rhodococcus corynebacterioides]MBY6363980.1 hypothetical protein [Rhodococcus corynebacterioides]
MTTAPDRATAKKALGIARETATTLAKGPAATGFVVTRKGVQVLRARRARAREDGGVSTPVRAPRPARRRRSGRSRVLRIGVLGLVAAAAAGALAAARSRRTELPPPAAEPPRLDTPVNGSRPSPRPQA